MAYERWYPSVTPLADGEMLITEGHDRADAPSTHVPEVRQVNGQFRPLTAPPVLQPLPVDGRRARRAGLPDGTE